MDHLSFILSYIGIFVNNYSTTPKIIGWDIGINTDGEPILIEFNSNPGQNQYSCGPTFGDLTDEVLEDVFNKQTLKNSRN